MTHNNFTIVAKNLSVFLEDKWAGIENHKSFKEVIEIVEDLDGAFLAGGAPLAIYQGKFNKIKDWDLYFDSLEHIEAAAQKLNELGYREEKKSVWGKTYIKDDNIIQVMDFKTFDSVEEVFKSFDFSVCCFAVEGDVLTYSKQAAEDVSNKVINFIDTETPIICLKRLAKYGAKGFKPTNNCVVGIISAIKRMTPNVINMNDETAAPVNGAVIARGEDTMVIFDDYFHHRISGNNVGGDS